MEGEGGKFGEQKGDVLGNQTKRILLPPFRKQVTIV